MTSPPGAEDGPRRPRPLPEVGRWQGGRL